MLIRYWIEFDDLEFPSVLGFGCGVTAYNLDDALKVMRAELASIGILQQFNNRLPDIKNIVANVDISDLEENHVRPNIGNFFKRGVWWPTTTLNWNDYPSGNSVR